jgi:hypothetical protein
VRALVFVETTGFFSRSHGENTDRSGFAGFAIS